MFSLAEEHGEVTREVLGAFEFIICVHEIR